MLYHHLFLMNPADQFLKYTIVYYSLYKAAVLFINETFNTNVFIQIRVYITLKEREISVSDQKQDMKCVLFETFKKCFINMSRLSTEAKPPINLTILMIYTCV